MVSIVICTYNRQEYLPKCLAHLKAQNCEANDYEIVLINNNSTDNTEAICNDFKKANKELNISYFLEENPGLSFARNRGIKEAKGSIICFIDDDGFAIPEYVNIISKFARNKTYESYMAFGGKVIPCYNEGMSPKWITPYISGLVSEVDLGKKVKTFAKKYPAGCNMIFRKEFFEKHGGFNTDLHTRGDDKFIFLKLKEKGYKILYIPSLEVSHFIDDYRLEESFIIRLSKVIGQSEYIRLQNNNIAQRLVKQIEYLIKLKIALGLGLLYLCRGSYLKARYLILVRWNVLKGYYISEKL
ncbi:glycosyltransferase [Crocinitomicaceae bacterium]|jgi:glycosyltransferase involved in cell wall biosynthesis|nr:glycosyltransferase [Crocinitomicaceae bacterium]MDB4650008.1 glycosyltransferase [Crocinitomicaceae bacterium]